jgi:RHS repeat-associated protein
MTGRTAQADSPACTRTTAGRHWPVLLGGFSLYRLACLNGLAALMVLAVAGMAHAESLEVIPYLAAGYQYRVVEYDAGSGFEQPGFDASKFSTGNAGFGSPAGRCSLNNPDDVKTKWPLFTDILVRKEFELPVGIRELQVSIVVDNDVQVYVNGQEMSAGLAIHEDCPSRSQAMPFVAPASVLKAGKNLLAVRARDRGDLSYLDIKATATVVPVALALGSAPFVAGRAGDSVHTAFGNYHYQHTDLNLPGRGLPLAFTRVLNVQDAVAGPFGPGWTHSYNLTLTENGDGSVVIRRGDGRLESYDVLEGGGYRPRDPGVFGRLAKQADGRFMLTEKNQTRLAFSAAGRLDFIGDRNGNRLGFAYDEAGKLATITDTVGRLVTLSYDGNGLLVGLTDPSGRSVTYGYDGDGRLVSDTDPNGGVRQYRYDTEGLLDRITDRTGKILTANTYDAAQRVLTRTDGNGAVTRFAYDTPLAGRTSVTDARGGVGIYAHDTLGRVIAHTDPLNHRMQFAYDARGNRSRDTDRNGNVTAFSHDERGNVLTTTEALGRVTAMEYNGLNDPTRRVDALGGTTRFGYDAGGNLNAITDALGKPTAMSHDSHGQLLTVTDPLGRVTTHSYDDQGNRVQVQDALGNRTRFSYDGVGRCTGVTDANGYAVGFAYDANGNRVSVTAASGYATTYSYDAENRRSGVTDPRGYKTRLAYDGAGLLVEVTDALSNKTAFEYDASGNRIRLTDPRGNVTGYGYDAADRLVAITDALGKVTQLAYDSNGNLLSRTDPLGHASRFGYDELNRRVSAADALGHQGTRGYDELGRLIQTRDAAGRVTGYGYDALGRLIRVTDPAGSAIGHAYDDAGNRTGITDPGGHVRQLEYDALNRLVRATDPSGHPRQYDYDAVGNRIGATDAKGQLIHYVYDADRRLTEIQYPVAADHVRFGYDEAGNRIHMSDRLGDSSSVYDALNRLISHTDPFGKTVAGEYDAAGNRTALSYPDGKRVVYGFDALNRLTSVADWLGGVTGYSYDAAGNLSQSLTPNQTAASYGYDKADRLVQLAHVRSSDNAVLAGYALTLDALGNPLGIERTEPAAAALPYRNDSYAYDEDNRLMNVNGNPLGFDDNDNQLGKESGSYGYDFEDRLVAVSGTTEYGYDGGGNRLKAVRGGVETRYTLDIGGASGGLVMESDAKGDPEAYYVHGLGPIARITPDGDARYYHFDPAGNTVALTGPDAAVTDAYAYDAFGQLLNEPNAGPAAANPFRHRGRLGAMDEGNGLLYLVGRYYDPVLGRFISKSRPALDGGGIDSVNGYAYSANNPVAIVEPARSGGKAVVQEFMAGADGTHAAGFPPSMPHGKAVHELGGNPDGRIGRGAQGSHLPISTVDPVTERQGAGGGHETN